ncbi:hypothetical protein [Phytomonospora endophytica]|uniref:Uncharacterized protein n=1 Tax=Phytomonospora endophytica TaxID=714109 RepID=A0A841FG35_9ACTN|nr:hypothetical protein [Phytomonospora endophytica]MBB6036291.1 hypothetical protein [Phytomonospora endophytica]GIG67198.1 hypothetical protein Pen01_34930 [Phytomonospora endophytica]
MTRYGTAALAAVIIGVGLLAGCTSASQPDDPPSPTVSNSAPVTDTAGDGGRAEIVESAVTALKDAYIWAVGVKNTSASDLLVVVRLSGGEETNVNGVLHTILPGQTMYTGARVKADAAPATISPSVTETRWVPMETLARNDMDAGVELIEGGLEHGSDSYIARVSFSTRGVGVPAQTVELLILFRDAEGVLLGGMATGSTGVAAAGASAIRSTFDFAEWPAGADEAASTVTISVSCCAVIE